MCRGREGPDLSQNGEKHFVTDTGQTDRQELASPVDNVEFASPHLTFTPGMFQVKNETLQLVKATH